MRNVVFLATILSANALLGVPINSESDLDSALSGGMTPLDFESNITRTAAIFPLFPVNSTDAFAAAANNPTINGNNFSYSGGGSGGFRGLMVRSNTLLINDLMFTNCEAHGGNGGNGQAGGGGGCGVGGALFVYNGASVTVNNGAFTNNSARGGDSGAFPGFLAAPAGGGSINGQTRTRGGNSANSLGTLAATGGGGYGGIGGLAENQTRGGGGGGLATDGLGGTAGAMNGGDTFVGAESGGAGATGASNGGDAITLGGGGGGFGRLFGGGSGRGGDGFVAPGVGFAGGGGGGGGAGNRGGNGSFGAGGGGTVASDAPGGDGGFGAGGGGSLDADGPHSTSAFGGASGTVNVGGAGAGLGGTIFVMEGGDLTFTGSLSFSGNSVAAGSPAAGTSTPVARGADLFMMSGSDVTFDLSSNFVMQTPIEGNLGIGNTLEDPMTTGSLTKEGSELLVLSGTNTYSRETFVNDGELRISGSVTSDITVSGGTLSGSFSTIANAATSVAGDLTVDSGVFSPGNSGIGTVEIAGEYQHNGGTLLVDITPTGLSDTVLIPGGTTIISGGTLEIFVGTGNYIGGTTYVVIPTAVSGQFSPPTLSGPGADLVELEVTYSSLLITILSSQLFVGQTVLPGPPSEVAACLEAATLTPGSDLALVIEVLGTLSNSAVNTALTNLSPNCFAALEWINARNTSRIANLLDQRMWTHTCCSSDTPCFQPGVWVSVYGNLIEHTRDYDFLRPFDSHTAGVIAGFDQFFPCGLYLGGAVGWNGTDFKWDQERGGGQLSTYFASLYGLADLCLFDVSFSATGGGDQNNLKRHIEFGNMVRINRNARSHFQSQFLTAHLQLQKDFFAPCVMARPFFLGDYHYYHRNSFRESGAGEISLIVTSKTQHLMRLEGGIYFSNDWNYDCLCLTPYASISWLGEFPFNTSKQTAKFKGIQDCSMVIESYDSLFMFGSPTVGVEINRNNGIAFLAEYKGIFNKATHIHQIEGRLNIDF